MGKGDRDENPVRAFQRAEKKREAERNRAQRQQSKELHKLKYAPSGQIRSELEKLMNQDKEGKLNSLMRDKMLSLQTMYKEALIREQSNPDGKRPLVRSSREAGVWVPEKPAPQPVVKQIEINLGDEKMLPPAIRRMRLQQKQPPPPPPQPPKTIEKQEPEKDDDLLDFEAEMKKIGAM